MKRFISLMLMAVLLFCTIPVRGNAVGNQVQTFYFEDGSYMTVEVITNGARASVQNRGANRIHIMTAMEKRYGKRL